MALPEVLISLFYSWKICIKLPLKIGASLVAQMVKNLPAMQETWVRSLGWEDALEKEMAILAWRIPRTEEPGGLKSMGSQKSQMWLSD